MRLVNRGVRPRAVRLFGAAGCCCVLRCHRRPRRLFKTQCAPGGGVEGWAWRVGAILDAAATTTACHRLPRCECECDCETIGIATRLGLRARLGSCRATFAICDLRNTTPTRHVKTVPLPMRLGYQMRWIVRSDLGSRRSPTSTATRRQRGAPSGARESERRRPVQRTCPGRGGDREERPPTLQGANVCAGEHTHTPRSLLVVPAPVGLRRKIRQAGMGI